MIVGVPKESLPGERLAALTNGFGAGDKWLRAVCTHHDC